MKSQAVKAVVCTALGLAIGLASATGAAQQDDWDGKTDDDPPTRRSDFTFGAAVGPAFVSLRAFPNEADQIGDPEFRTDTGTVIGPHIKLWIGVTLSDWLVFGIGGTGFNWQTDDLDISGGAVLFRVETYPLFYKGGVFEDLALYGDFGAGTLKIKDDNKVTVGDAGGLSLVAGGLHWEPLQFSKFSAGPYVEYQRYFSQSLTGNAGMLGFRIAFYGGPSEPEPEPPVSEQYPYHPSVRPGPQPAPGSSLGWGD